VLPKSRLTLANGDTQPGDVTVTAITD
jgi:hypothetical protein